MSNTKDFSTQVIASMLTTPDGTVLHSKNRHDCQSYADKVSGEVYMLDGGNDYTRQSINAVEAKHTLYTMQDPHEVRRTAFAWRTFGKNGEFLPNGKFSYLKDMQTDHIRAILDTQQHIIGTYVEVLFKDELKWREEHDNARSE